MKKIALLIGSMLLFAASTASAEHRLLVTDVVDPGHAEAEIAWEFVHYNGDVKGNASELGLSLGVGLFKNLELDIALPYVLNEKIEIGDESEEVKGWGDLVVGAKYRILKESPITLTTSFDVAFDTGSSSVSGEEHSLVYSPSVAVSKDLGHETKPYAFYRAMFDSNGPDAHILAVGVEKELNHLVTLDAKFDTTFYVNAGDLRTYTFDVGAYFQVCKSFYVIPSLGISRLDADGADATALKAGAALYFIY